MDLPADVRRAAAGRRLLPYLEALALCSILLAVNLYAYPAAPAYQGFPVSPYMFAVLLIAARYGTLPGLATAGVAATVQVLDVRAATGDARALGFLTAAHGARPAALLLVALFAGAFTDRLRARLREAVAAFDRLRLARERLSTQFTLLADEKHLLDRQVLGQEETFEALIALFEDLDQLKPARFPKRILELVQRISGGRAALYRAGGPWASGDEVGGESAAVLLAGSGEDWPRGLAERHPVIRRALAGPALVTLAQVAGWQDLAVFRRDPIHAALKLDARWGGAQMLLVIRDLPFAGFAPARLRALELAMRVATKALRRAQRLARLGEAPQKVRLAKASSLAYFNSRLEEELALGRRYHRPVSLLKVRVRHLTEPVARVIESEVRASKLVAHVGDKRSITMLCPFAAPQEPEALAEQVRERLRALADDVQITVLKLEAGS